jgi:GT2 family glycosyltransferase
MVESLVATLLRFLEVGHIRITCNIPESLKLPENPKISIIHNVNPAGFASNHNAAFRDCRLPYFCVLNPDLQLPVNPFPSLLAVLRAPNAAVAAPVVKNSCGIVEDSIRFFPTIRTLLAKGLGHSDGRFAINTNLFIFHPEWVAGMFMLFRSASFAQLGGFDPYFFLYYEDVDICVRIWKGGMKVIACPKIFVLHDAQRASHRNLQHLRWHLMSMVRFFFKHWGRLPVLPK